jgi:hypothetical protein
LIATLIWIDAAITLASVVAEAIVVAATHIPSTATTTAALPTTLPSTPQ